MTMMAPLLCTACTRFDGVGACTSFPHGIPEDILVWGGDHRQSIDGEPPFELKPGGEDDLASWLRFSPAIDRATTKGET